jgi:hypothetical protein
MDCAAFNACHAGISYQQGGCRNWHWYCGLNHAFVNEVEEATQRGEVQILLASRGEENGKAEISANGRYVLVRNCEDRIVGAFLIAERHRV